MRPELHLLLLLSVLAGCTTNVQPVANKSTESENQVQLLASQSSDEGIIVRLTFTNNSRQDIFINKTNGCLGGSIANDVFRITDPRGKTIPYKLPLRKRLSPKSNEAVKLSPASTLTATVKLDRAYRFPPGMQSFKIIYAAVHSQADGSPTVLTAETTAILNVFARKEIDTTINTRRPLNEAEQSQVRKALDKAKELLANRKSELDTWTSIPGASKDEFTTWFGKDDEPTRSKVRTAIQKAMDLAANLKLDNFSASTVTIKGEENVAAELDEFNRKIVLFPAFFNRPDSGTESKAGIVAHELFHFKEVAAAKDHDYGVTRCKELAKSFPNMTVENADNFEFYVEGTD
jgi:peptidyl-Lys metalloendopeptidase